MSLNRRQLIAASAAIAAVGLPAHAQGFPNKPIPEEASVNPQDLKTIVSSGLLSFPITDFDANGDFNAKGYAARLEWLAPYGVALGVDAVGACDNVSQTG
eukprot:gene17195-35560_t